MDRILVYTDGMWRYGKFRAGAYLGIGLIGAGLLVIFLYRFGIGTPERIDESSPVEQQNELSLEEHPGNQSEMRREEDSTSISRAIGESGTVLFPEVVVPMVSQVEGTGDGRIASTSAEFTIQKRLLVFGFGQAHRKSQDIDTIVLHSSFNNQGGDRYSVDKVIGIWKNYEVAPHFVIDRKGDVYRLVDEENIAYHAGVSEMKDGRKNVNDFSLGVEILNAEDDEYTDAQYGAVRDLVAYLKEAYPIKYVVGHDDIAPGRKTDPWNFDWKRIR